jgi:hypothetical protein
VELRTVAGVGLSSEYAMASLATIGCRGGSSPTPTSSKSVDVSAGHQRKLEAPPVVATSTPSGQSACHGVGLDGVAASDGDSIAKAMRRKAAANLDFACINKSSKSFFNLSNTTYCCESK